MRAHVAESSLAEVKQAEDGAAEEAAVLRRRLEVQAGEVQEAARRAEVAERAAERAEHARQEAMRQAACAAQVRAEAQSGTTSPHSTPSPRDSGSGLAGLRLPPSRSPRSPNWAEGAAEAGAAGELR